MATVKNGQLTASPEWAKHLRKRYKKLFWKGERRAEKKDAGKRALDACRS